MLVDLSISALTLVNIKSLILWIRFVRRRGISHFGEKFHIVITFYGSTCSFPSCTTNNNTVENFYNSSFSNEHPIYPFP